MSGSYNCAHCGDWTNFDAELIDYGACFDCEKCGGKTVFMLLTPEKYPVAINAIYRVAAQQITAPDRLPHSRSPEQKDTAAGGG